MSGVHESEPLDFDVQESVPLDNEFHDAAGTDWPCQVPVSPGWGSHSNRATQLALDAVEADAFAFCTRTAVSLEIDTTFVAPDARYTACPTALADERDVAAAETSYATFPAIAAVSLASVTARDASVVD